MTDSTSGKIMIGSTSWGKNIIDSTFIFWEKNTITIYSVQVGIQWLSLSQKVEDSIMGIEKIYVCYTNSKWWFYILLFFRLAGSIHVKYQKTNILRKDIFMSDCCLILNVQIVNYILMKTSYMRWERYPLYTIPTLMIGYVLLVHCVPSGEVTNSNFIFDYLTRPGLESTELEKKCVWIVLLL
jgi:hypothetical protein